MSNMSNEAYWLNRQNKKHRYQKHMKRYTLDKTGSSYTTYFIKNRHRPGTIKNIFENIRHCTKKQKTRYFSKHVSIERKTEKPNNYPDK